MSDFQGLRCKGVPQVGEVEAGEPIGSSPGGFLNIREIEIMWIEIPREPYLTEGYSPDTLIEHYYGDLQTTGTGVFSQGVITAETNPDAGTGSDGFTDYTDAQYYEYWRNTTTTVIMIGAVISNLPPISVSTGTQVGGFLDYTKQWGLTYDLDIMYKGFGSSKDSRKLLRDAMWLQNEGTSHDHALSSGVANMLELQDWIWAPQENTTWPEAAFNAFDNWFDGTTEEQARDYYYATTYGTEAMGYDAFDDFTFEPDGSVSWATPSDDITSVDANEALHSNTCFRVIPKNWEDPWEGSGVGTDSTHWSEDPRIITPIDVEDGYKINYTYAEEHLWAFASLYHALYDDGDSYTKPESYAGSQSHGSTNKDEIDKMEERVDDACKIIGPELEVISYPKRLINHVQKRRSIPDNLVSAFGYVPEDMYDPSVAATVLGDTSDEADAFLSTSTEMSADPTTNLPESMTDAYMESRGSEGSYGTRGSSEGYWSTNPATGAPQWNEGEKEDDKIICSELFRQGLMEHHIYEADERFGAIMRHTDPAVIEGYKLWARPVVKMMQRYSFVTRAVSFIANPWAKQMAHQMGATEKGSLIGKIIMKTGIPFCRMVNYLFSKNTENLLTKPGVL